MSIDAVTWALNAPIGGSQKVLLLGIANHAHPDGTEAYPGLDTLARYACCDRSTARRNVRKLIEAGLVIEDGLGPRGQAKYRLPMGVANCHPSQIATGGNGTPRGVANGAGGGGIAVPPEPSIEPSIEPNGNHQHQGEGARESWLGVPAEMQADAEALLRSKRKVAERIVTEEEMRIAAAALSEFNRQMESDYGIGAQVRAIVMRIRERPSWDEGKHMRLVQSAWRLRWWERNGNRRRPSPQVIYGNERVFEQVAQDAAEEAAGRAPERDCDLRTKVWPDGRRWTELTRAEQENAKEAVLMGLRPWEPRAEPQRSRPSAGVIDSAWLAGKREATDPILSDR